MPNRIEIDCPRCKGERGWFDGTERVAGPMSRLKCGTWHPCITCRTKGTIKVASQAEARRIEAMINKPKKVRTKQREKEG
jgi:hypothetical protein